MVNRFGAIVLAVLAMALLWPQQQEHFSTLVSGNTGAVVAMTQPSAFCTISKDFPDAFSDKKSLLLYRTCMGSKDPQVDHLARMANYVREVSYYTDTIEVNSNEFNDLVAAIEVSVKRVYDTNGYQRVRGPVYALVYQAPYYRDLRADVGDHVVHLQPFNIGEYQYRSSSILRDDLATGESAPAQGVYMVAYVLFPMYDKSMKAQTPPALQSSAVNRCLAMFLSQNTSEHLCRMRCPNTRDFTCGCLNLVGEGDDKAKYATVCLGPSAKKDRQKIERVTYGSMYRVNELAINVAQLFDPAFAYTDACTPPKR